MDDQLVLKNRLKVARAERSLSQGELAKLVGVSRQTISSIETGQFSPTAKLALVLCVALDKKFEELFYFDKKPALNPDLWGRLLDLCEKHTVRLHWVKGHAENQFSSRLFIHRQGGKAVSAAAVCKRSYFVMDSPPTGWSRKWRGWRPAVPPWPAPTSSRTCPPCGRWASRPRFGRAEPPPSPPTS